MPAHKIILGIDFGTTYSGVAWVRRPPQLDLRSILTLYGTTGFEHITKGDFPYQTMAERSCKRILQSTAYTCYVFKQL